MPTFALDDDDDDVVFVPPPVRVAPAVVAPSSRMLAVPALWVRGVVVVGVVRPANTPPELYKSSEVMDASNWPSSTLEMLWCSSSNLALPLRRSFVNTRSRSFMTLCLLDVLPL